MSSGSSAFRRLGVAGRGAWAKVLQFALTLLADCAVRQTAFAIMAVRFLARLLAAVECMLPAIGELEDDAH